MGTGYQEESSWFEDEDTPGFLVELKLSNKIFNDIKLNKRQLFRAALLLPSVVVHQVIRNSVNVRKPTNLTPFSTSLLGNYLNGTFSSNWVIISIAGRLF